MKTNADRLRATCLNCIYFDCAEDETASALNRIVRKGTKGLMTECQRVESLKDGA